MDFPLAKVLLATDGSKDATLAARAAVDVCEGTGAELYIVHVWHPIPTARLRAFMRAELKQLGNELLQEGAKSVEDAGGRVAAAHLLEGRTADEILNFAGEIEAGLVVIGSRGLGPVGRIALGSVSEAVVHHAGCPVLVLRGGEGSWPPKRVIFGDDASEAARAAGDLAAVLCGRHDAQGLVLHAYPPLPEVDAEGREFDPRIVDDDLRQAEKDLMQRAQELERCLGSRPKVSLVAGDAAACLLEAAEADAPKRTLVTLGSRGLGPIGRMRLGSVSTKVLHAAEGPVLVHPALRDASATPEEWNYYQEHVYRLRGKEYRSRGIRTDLSVRRREWSRAEALRAEDAGAHRTWWGRLLGRRK